MDIKEIIEEKIDQIAEAIVSIESDNYITNNFIGDKLGAALFLVYYSKYKQKQKYYNIGFEFISEIFDVYSSDFSNPLGLSKFGWFVEHLSKNDFISIDTNYALSDIDEFLFSIMIKTAQDGNYDFLHGAISYGLYFLNRVPNRKTDKYLGELITTLEKTCIDSGNNQKKWLSVLNSEKDLSGYNISLSHGIASLIVFFSKIYNRNIERDKTSILLKGSIKYLINQKLDITKYNSFFSMWAKESMDKITSSRLAWCYGDLGIAVSMWHSSQVLNDRKLENDAISIFLHSSKRKKLDENGVIDAGFCHGTSGIAHIFNRMYGYTGIEELKVASNYWFLQTLKMSQFKDGIAGYKTWLTERYGGWKNNISLLEGVSGIGLTMISAVSNIEPTWDECLLLS
ncbi:MAG: lanthionine synthetase C family protein [Bacteroidales bacterium]